MGGRDFQQVLKRIEQHHNQQRPHQGLANAIPLDFDYPAEPVQLEKVYCESVLGGLTNHYYAEKAA